MKNVIKNPQKLRSYIMLSLGLAIMFLFILFALFPKVIAPYNPNESFEAFLPCSIQHIFGTNNLGYDLFSELIYATRSTLIIGLLAALIALVIGTIIGIISGYLDGIIGEGINSIINLFLLIPLLPLAIVISAYLGSGQQNVIITIAVLGWCSTARSVRAKTIKLKNMPYVETMKGLGFSRLRIMFRHILPNLSDVIFSRYILSVASCIMLEATLGFLGLSDITNVTWGAMVNLAYKYGGLARGAYNWFIAPGVCIALLTLSFYLINYFFENRASEVKGSSSILE